MADTKFDYEVWKTCERLYPFGERLTRWQQKRGFSNEFLAAAVQITVECLAMMKSGHIQPSQAQREKLIKVLNTEENDL